MLHDVIRNKIEYPEVRVLYDSRMRITYPHMQREMQSYIQRFRQKYSSKTIIDKLAQKASHYKNDGSWYKARIAELEKAVFNPKMVPEEFKGKWRSIEFELLFRNKNALQEFITKSRCKKWAQFMHIKTDGSVRDESDHNAVPHEITLSYKSGEEKSVREICDLFKGLAYTNKTCGTHVHFDMRHTDETNVKLYGQRLVRAIPALKILLPPTRRDNKFCKNPINDFSSGDQERYSFVNLASYRKHKTLEIRAHGGTINANKILNWIRLCELIMTSRVRSKNDEINTLDELIALYKLDSKMSSYLKKRGDKFNGYSAKNEEDIPELDDAPALEPFEVDAIPQMAEIRVAPNAPLFQ